MQFFKIASLAAVFAVSTASGLTARDIYELGARDAYDELVARDSIFDIEERSLAFEEDLLPSLTTRDLDDLDILHARGLFERSLKARSPKPTRRPNAPSFSAGTIKEVNEDFKRKELERLKGLTVDKRPKKDPLVYVPRRPDEQSGHNGEFFSSKDADAARGGRVSRRSLFADPYEF